MIIDALNTFANGTALNTGAAGDYLVGDVIDLQTAAYALNDTDDIYLILSIAETGVTSGGAATVAFSLVTDDNSSFTSPAVVAATAAIPKATLIAGYLVWQIELPKGFAYERYLGILQTTAVAALTAGKINAFLTNTPRTHRAFPDGLASGA